jgi:hypothetical protein
MLESFDVTRDGLTFSVRELENPLGDPTARILRASVYLAKPETPTKPETNFGGDITFDVASGISDELMKTSAETLVERWAKLAKATYPKLVQMVK